MFFNDVETAANPRAKGGKKPPFVPKVLSYPSISLRPFVEFTDDELYAARGSTLIYDIEIYPNYFCVAFKCPLTKRVVWFEMTPDSPAMNYDKLNWIVHHFRLISFNGNRFDIPLLWLAIFRYDVATLKKVANDLIDRNRRGGNDRYTPADVAEAFGVYFPSINHIDIIEVAPLMASLKTYAGRLHAPRMQDLPYDPHMHLNREQATHVLYYCVNDLDNTILLYNKLIPEIKLREQLSEEYEQDLRSRSDAQIAEHVIAAECEKINGYRARRPIIKPGTVFKYQKPDWVEFQTPMMRRILSDIEAADFVISEKGSPKCSYLKGLQIKIADGVYRMGVGGLHSTESCAAWFAKDGYLLVDRDVASYYPRIILNNLFFPKHLTKTFLVVYNALVERRLAAKGLSKSSDLTIAELNEIIADSLKITINGSFGKLGSKYSSLYSPDLLIQVTITGQLALLMLIEAMELVGIRVVSANTDGIVLMPHVSQYDQMNGIIKAWENHTAFETEETQYQAILSRDVNNYIALKRHWDKGSKQWSDQFPIDTPIDKKYKGKGVFGETTLKKQPNSEICAKAVASFLIDGTPIRDYVDGASDIRDFIVVKSIGKGGVAEKDGVYLGKAIRWYYANGVKGTINKSENGAAVQGSEGGKPCMDLPESMPDDVNLDLYGNMAEDMLSDMGFYGKKKSKRPDLFDDIKPSDRNSW